MTHRPDSQKADTPGDSDSGFAGREIADQLQAPTAAENESGEPWPLDPTLAMRDFRGTFELANGSEAQNNIFKLMAALYKQHADPAQLAEAIEHIEQSINAQKPNLPRGHLPIPKNQLHMHGIPESHGKGAYGSSFQDRFERFKSYLHELSPAEDSDEYRDELQTILLGSAQADIDYLSRVEGRPGREGTQLDPFESYFREYVLGDKLKGSRFLLRLRDQLRQEFNADRSGDSSLDIQGLYIEMQMELVVNLWRQHHPGQKFYAPQ